MFSLINIIKAIAIGFFWGIIASIPLGPSGLESVSRSISKGFREGFKVSLGAVSADITYIIIINLGLFTMFARNSKFNSLFFVICGAILILSYKISSKSKNANDLEKSIISKHASNGFFTGFLITFLNPTTPSVWIAFSGTLFSAWRHHGTMYFFFAIFSMILGSITWFCFLNIMVSKGVKKFKPNFANNASKLLDYFLLALGIIFIILGGFKLIFPR